MSRIGKQHINVPSDVSVEIDKDGITVVGPKGTLKRSFHQDMAISKTNGFIAVNRPTDSGNHKALHGLTRSLLNNMVIGVSQGFTKTLDLVGVGYRVTQNGSSISLSVMLSHQVDIQPIDGINLEVEGNNRIRVMGIDKQAVGQQAAQIRKVRPPNVYTGKGIRYAGEVVHIKPGKSARRV